MEESSIVNGHLQHTDLKSLCFSRHLALDRSREVPGSAYPLVVSMEPTTWQQQFPALAVARGSSIAGAEVISFFSPDENAYNLFWTDRAFLFYCLVHWHYSSTVYAFV